MDGAALRAWRRQHGLTQAALGQLLGGLSKAVISRMETGATAVHPSVVMLCYVLSFPKVYAGVAARQGVGLREA